MAKGSNASPEVFGFDFQVNATIFLLLDNIREVKTVRMEGASEDIELTKSAADAITDDNDHDGVGKFIAEHLLTSKEI